MVSCVRDWRCTAAICMNETSSAYDEWCDDSDAFSNGYYRNQSDPKDRETKLRNFSAESIGVDARAFLSVDLRPTLIVSELFVSHNHHG
jgi:hypothetical protein